MSPRERLAAALEAMRWSAQSFASIARVNERTVRRWLAGDNPVPAGMLTWAEMFAAFLNEHPVPARE